MGEIIKVTPEVTIDKYNVTLNQDVTEIGVKIEMQTREINVFIQSFAGAFQNFYTKEESDARFMPIDYLPEWDEVQNKPTTFPPSAHTHPISQVDGLQTALDGKQPVGDYATQTDIDNINLEIADINIDLNILNGQVTDIYSELDGKVDKVTGKGLSTNDYTTAEKDKLAGIQAGAEVNVNADWNSISGDSQILNKPSLSEVATSGDYNDLNNIPTEFTPAPHTHIIGDVDGLQAALDGKQPIGDYLIDSDLDPLRSDITTIQGDITDIQADIVDINIELGNKVDKVAGKGLSTNDFDNTYKTKLDGIEAGAEVNVNADWNATTGDAQILNKPTEFTPAPHTHPISDIIDLETTLESKADLVDGKVPASQLPSFVDDVIEVANYASLPAVGDAGVIYVTLDDNKTYRWGGSTYVEISPSLALGETSETAYRGDRGKIAYDHSQTTGNPHNTTKGDIGLGNVDNTSDLDKPVSTATQTALDGKVDKEIGKGLSTNDFDNTYKSKLDGIEAGAEVNVNADWDATTGDAQILNKPTNLSEFVNDLPIPTLDEVTDAGYFTDNYVEFGGVKAPLFDLDTTVDAGSNIGRMKWDLTDNTLAVDLLNGVTLQVGQEEHIYAKAVGSIANGSPVQFAGVQGNHLLIKTAVASEINANPEYFVGIATQSFANNDFGYVTTFGKVHELNTSSYTLGQVLYFNSVSGGLTATKPAYPNARIIVAAVVKVHATQGILMVRPHTEYYSDWNEISNKPSSFTPSAHTHAISDVINLQSSLNLKANAADLTAVAYSGSYYDLGDIPTTFTPSAHTHTISEVIGLQTALNGKEPTITAGTTSQYWRGDKTWQTLDKTAVGLSNVDNTSDLNKPISTATQTALNSKIGLTSLSATSPLSYNNTTGVFSIQQASGSQSGFLSSTDWTTFNNKQNALTNPITGTGSSGRVAFFNGTTTQTSNSNLFWDNTNNRLGIGTASPSYTLHTVGSTYLNGATQIAASTTGLPNNTSSGWAATSGATYRHYIGDGTGYDFRFSLRNAGINYDRIYIQESGYVGLGVSPSYRLQLTDDSAAKPSTNTWTIASDKRVKENINPYTKGLETILAINPVTYDYNGKAGFDKIQGNIGVIAQEMLDILPEGISTFKAKLNEDDEQETELFNFNSHALTYVLINAIKEQQRQIDELKALLSK